MNCEPKISVIMSVYKEPLDILSESVESILFQTFEDFEFIIILDNPDNKEIILYFKELERNDNRVRFFINEKNVGLVSSLNRALSLSKGYYIARMDADDVSKRTRLENQLLYLETNELEFIGSSMIEIDMHGRNMKNKLYPTKDDTIRKQLKNHSCIPHPTWFLKKSIYVELNGYRDIDSCEDYDFLIRAAGLPITFGNIESNELYYRINPNSISRTKTAKQTVISRFLSSKFKKGEVINESDVQSYLDSDYGKKEIQLQEEYIKLWKKEKYKKNEKKYFTYSLLKVYRLFLTKIGRKNLIKNFIK